jgi:glycosyltransferase involved in cell wall biosynthesis
VLLNGETGILVEADDTKAMTDSIVCLPEDDALRHAMGEAGKERLEQEFSFERFRGRLGKMLSR